MSKAREKREEPVFDDDADKERWSAIVRAATASLIAKQQQQQRQLSSAAPESAAAAPAHVAGQETDRTARRKAKKEAKKASKKAALTNPSTDSHSLPNGGDNDASKMKAIIQSARADVQKKAVSETAAAAPSPAASKTSSALPGLWPSSQKAIAGQAPSERQVVPSASASKKRKRASETIPQATKTLQLPAQVSPAVKTKKRRRESSPQRAPVASTSGHIRPEVDMQRPQSEIGDGVRPAKKRKPRHRNSLASSIAKDISVAPDSSEIVRPALESAPLQARAPSERPESEVATAVESVLTSERAAALLKPTLDQRMTEIRAWLSAQIKTRQDQDAKQRILDNEKHSSKLSELATANGELVAKVQMLERQVRQLSSTVESLTSSDKVFKPLSQHDTESNASSAHGSPASLDRRLGKRERSLLRNASHTRDQPNHNSEASDSAPSRSTSVRASEPRLALRDAIAAAPAATIGHSTESLDGDKAADSSGQVATVASSESESPEESDNGEGEIGAARIRSTNVKQASADSDDEGESDADISSATTVVLPSHAGDSAAAVGPKEQPPSSHLKSDTRHPIVGSSRAASDAIDAKMPVAKSIGESSSGSEDSSSSSPSSSDDDSSSSSSNDSPKRPGTSSLSLLSKQPRTSLSQIAASAFASPSKERRASLPAPPTKRKLVSPHSDEVQDDAERELRRLSQTHVRPADLMDSIAAQEEDPIERAQSGELVSTESDSDGDDARERKYDALRKRNGRISFGSQRARMSSSEPHTEDEDDGVVPKTARKTTASDSEASAPLTRVSLGIEANGQPAQTPPSLDHMGSQELLHSIANFLPPRSTSQSPVPGDMRAASSAADGHAKQARPIVEVEIPAASSSKARSPSESPAKGAVTSLSRSPAKQRSPQAKEATSNSDGGRGALSEIDDGPDSEASDQISPSFANKDVNGSNQNDDALRQLSDDPASPQESQFVPLPKQKALFLDESAPSITDDPSRTSVEEVSPRPLTRSTKSKMQNGALSSHANGLPAIRRTTRRSESVETAVPDSSSQADMIARSQLTSQSQPQVTGAGAAAAIGRGLRNVANGLFKSATNLGDVSSSASKIPSSSNAPTLRTRQPPSSAPVGRSTRASGMPSLSQLDSLALRSPAGASQSKRRGTDLPSKKPQPSSQLSWLRKKGSPEENSSGDDDSDSN